LTGTSVPAPHVEVVCVLRQSAGLVVHPCPSICRDWRAANERRAVDAVCVIVFLAR
jgi:hypothetical protein